MSRRFKTLGLVLALIVAAGLALAGWKARQAGPKAGPPVAAPAPAIELAPGDVATATQAELSTQLVVSGGLRAVHSAFVKAKLAAEIVTLSVREGDRVAAGQLLGTQDAIEYQWRLRQAEDQAAAAQAQLDIAQRTLDNNKALVDRGFISRNALETSASSAASARASLQAARAAAEIARKAVNDSAIRAPIAGLVAQRLVQPGERVTPETRLLEIVDLSRIELEAAVAPEDVPSLRIGQAARVQVDGLADVLPAKVVRINPSASTSSRAVMSYLELQPGPAMATLRQGLFARATIELQRKTALVVPESALRFDQARPYVLVLEGGQAQQRGVTTGLRGTAAFDGRGEAAVEIAQGLQAGAVVLRGTVGGLKAGTPLTHAAAARPASAAR